MKHQKGFAFITLLIVLATIGLSALIGLRFYSNNPQEISGSSMVQDKAKNVVVQANAEVVRSLIQAALDSGDINLNEVVILSQNAGLHNPFNEILMNTPEWFPEAADSPGEIQITLDTENFYVQGCGADGLLANILTVRK